MKARLSSWPACAILVAGPVVARAGWDAWVQTLFHGLVWLIFLLWLFSEESPAEILRRWIFSGTGAACLLFLLAGGLSFGLSDSPCFARNGWLIQITAVLFLFWGWSAFSGRPAVRRFCRIVAGTAAALGLWAILERVFRGGNVSASMVHPNTLAWFLAFSLPPAAAWARAERRRGALGIPLLIFAGLLATRSAFGMLCAVAAWAAWLGSVRRRPAWVFAGLGGWFLISAGGLAIQAGRGLEHRPYWWAAALRMVRDSPWVGQGPGVFAFAYPRFAAGPAQNTQYAHSGYLEMLGETGLIGLAGFLLLAGLSLRRIFGRPGEGESADPPGLGFGVLAGLLHATGDFGISFPANLWVLFAAMGILLAGAPSRPPAPAFQVFLRRAPTAIRIVLCVLAAGSLRASWRMFQGERLAVRAMYEPSPQARRRLAEEAFRADPLSLSARLILEEHKEETLRLYPHLSTDRKVLALLFPDFAALRGGP